MNRKQITIAIIMMFSVAVFHFFIPRDFLSLHILFRLLYLVPIAYIALNFGRKGGVIAAIAVTIIFLPHFFMVKTSHEFVAGNIAAVVLFYLTGLFVGSFRDKAERGITMQQQQRQVVIPSAGEGCNILFYIDGSPLSAAVAEWFSAFFANRNITITLLWIYNEDETEKFASPELASEHVSQVKVEGEASIEKIREDLLTAGIQMERISVKNIAVTGKIPFSDKILEELKADNYDLVLLAKHDQTKAQEFLFGDTAIRLLREASIPVLSVKGVPEKSEQ
ncbi:MAG: universal stress protein [Desulfobulbaceae bacterium]|nr:universal stress protein [Desulfobulbaceae bacterium]